MNADSINHATRVAIIGRPNVGKSTLFNRLCGKKLAIAGEFSGITRDYKEYIAKLYDLQFIAVDTAGWSRDDGDEEQLTLIPLRAQIIKQTERAIAFADIILFLFDGKSEITNDDKLLAKIVHKSNKNYIVAINKSECSRSLQDSDVYSLGLGEPIFISALHGYGLDDLYKAICNMAPSDSVNKLKERQKSDLSIAIVGRPNVGKSTLFNALLGEERSIISDIAGTTRDCIEQTLKISKKMTTITDTAGMRRNGKVENDIESSALGQSIAAIRRSSVIVLLMDAMDALTNQDIAIARIAINEGKPLILVVNKVDLVKNRELLKKTIKLSVSYNFTDVYAVPIAYISSVNGDGINLLIDVIFEKFEKWQKSFTTSVLNEWMRAAVEENLPPRVSNGRRLKLKYITQQATRPPTFNIFANIPEKIPSSYQKYLRKSLARYFNLEGIPIRFAMNRTLNPYVDKKNEKKCMAGSRKKH